MRTVLLLALTTLAGCIFVVDRDHDDDRGDFLVDTDGARPQRPHHRPDDTDAPAETDETDETDAVAVPACGDAEVQALLAALATGTTASCGHGALFVTATGADGAELQLQLQVDTLPGVDAPTEPYEAGQTFTASLGNGEAGGSARLVLGAGLANDACNDLVDDDTLERRAWLGVAGTVTIEVTDANDRVDGGEALFQADVTVQGVEVEDDAGDRCAVPDATWTDRWMGWQPG